MKSNNKKRQPSASQSADHRLRGQVAKPTAGIRWRSILATAGISAAIIIAALALILPGYDENADPVVLATRLAQARQFLENKNFPEAEQLASTIPSTSPLFEQSRLVAGEAATRNGRLTEALAYYGEIAQRESKDALLAAYASGEIYRSQSLIAPALKAYQHVLDHEPDNVSAHERVAFLLGVTRQHWQAAQHHLAIVRQRAWTLDSLAILSDIERSIEQPAFVAQCVQQAPNEPLTMLAQAAELLYEGKQEQARPLLEKAVAQDPGLLTAQALLGELLLKEDQATLTGWNAQLPTVSEKHPDIWYVRGMQARGAQELKIAAGCFAQAVRLAPEHRRASYQLGQLLTQIGFPNSGPIIQRAKLQAELGLLLDQILASRGQSESAIQQAAEISEELGRVWEAWAWATTGSQLFPTASWPLPIVRRLSPQLSPELPRTLPQANLATDVDLNPLVMAAAAYNWSGRSSPTRRPGTELAANDQREPSTNNTKFNTNSPAQSSALATDASAVTPRLTYKLEDNAGINFVYNNGPDPETPGARMFEQTGGGVGVIDFDNDAWPDLYFTQGSPWKTGQTTPTPDPQFHDTIFHNLQGETFQEVSGSVRISELNYSQGVAIGDYDADGFDDILVGNIGPCTLWHNNGDGTFSDTTWQLGPQPDAWTTSVLLADLNGDTICDIFKVTYLKGTDVYTAICNGKGCSPKGFEGEVDQLLLGSDDGTFQLQPDACPTVDSKGMGVVAFKMGDAPNLSLFISNDQVANYLLVPEQNNDGRLRFNDEALVRGAALNSDGLPMAGMGIAADDIDSNGLLDLLVTNFANEANTLYMQDSPGLFVDTSQVSGMQAASYAYVGWGTQLLDIDLDGDSDLVIVNGHVDDYRLEGGMYEMPPQLFKNVGRGRFVMVPPEEAGDYFAGKYSARGLAMLDWNRDGRMDFVVSNIAQPASLVTNITQTPGHVVSLELVGTQSPRQPRGAQVTIRSASGTVSKQLTGGSGYQASNQCCLHFGLGAATSLEQLSILWPSGQTQVFHNLPVDALIRMVEGQSTIDVTPIAPVPSSTQARAL